MSKWFIWNCTGCGWRGVSRRTDVKCGGCARGLAWLLLVGKY